jgi:hypothetical protein
VESFPDDPSLDKNEARKRNEKEVTLLKLTIKHSTTPLMWRNYLIIGSDEGLKCLSGRLKIPEGICGEISCKSVVDPAC